MASPAVPPAFALDVAPQTESAGMSNGSDDDTFDRWELTLGPAIVSASNANSGALGAHFGLGYFLTPAFEISLRETVFYASFPNGTNWMSLTRGALDYQFNLDRWHPFIGPELGYGVGVHNTSSFEFGGEAGIKYDLTQNIFLTGMVEYQDFLRRRSFSGGIRENALIFYAGIGFRW